MFRDSFRRWCSPSVVLLVIAPTDDLAQVVTAARYAELTGAKLMLAQTDVEIHTGRSSKGESRSMLRSVPLNKLWKHRDSKNALMSVDILRRAFVLNAVSDHEIPALVRAFNIDRILVSQCRQGQHVAGTDIVERLIAISPVPVWILGRSMGLNVGTPTRTRRILLPVTHSPEDEFAFQFASELAMVEGASLSVLHVFGRVHVDHPGGEKTPVTIKSWLPDDRLAETSLVSVVEIAVRQGDPVTEILEFNVRKPHDLVILRRSPAPRQVWPVKADVVGRLCSTMPCPLLVLGSPVERPVLRPELVGARASRSRMDLVCDQVEREG